jgi:hypothetical protein
MPKPAERVKDAAKRFRQRPPGLGPPGLNPLFIAVLAATIVALLAGLTAGDAELLQSNLIFRFVVGGVVLAILYGVIAVTWLAWHRRLLKRLNIGAAGGETPDQESAKEISQRDEEIKDFMDTTTNAIEELAEEQENGG